MNVLTQVVERHLLTDFEEIVPDEIDKLNDLVKLDHSTERKKEEIEQRLHTIVESLKALDALD